MKVIARVAKTWLQTQVRARTYLRLHRPSPEPAQVSIALPLDVPVLRLTSIAIDGGAVVYAYCTLSRTLSRTLQPRVVGTKHNLRNSTH